MSSSPTDSVVHNASTSAALPVFPPRRSRKGTPHRAPGSVDETPLLLPITNKKTPTKRSAAPYTEPLPKCLRGSNSAISKTQIKQKRTPKPTAKFENFQVNMPSKGGLRRNAKNTVKAESSSSHSGAAQTPQQPRSSLNIPKPLVVHVVNTLGQQEQ